MTIIEIYGTPLTPTKLERRSKYELAQTLWQCLQLLEEANDNEGQLDPYKTKEVLNRIYFG